MIYRLNGGIALRYFKGLINIVLLTKTQNFKLPFKENEQGQTWVAGEVLLVLTHRHRHAHACMHAHTRTKAGSRFNITKITRQMLAASWGKPARDIPACLLYISRLVSEKCYFVPEIII